MPAKSSAQYGLMQAIAHGTHSPGLGGPSPPSKKVASDFISKTPKAKRKKFARAIMSRRSAKNSVGIMSAKPSPTQEDDEGMLEE